MNDIAKPNNRTEAANTIYEIIKEFYGDCTSVNIFVNCSGMDIESTEKPFTVERSMRTINGDWLPRKEV